MALLFLYGSAFSQSSSKPVLQLEDLEAWPKAEVPKLTSDAHYKLYSIRDVPRKSSTLLIQSLDGGWSKEYIGGRNASFTSDNSRAIFISTGDSLCILKLGTSTVQTIRGISTFNLITEGSNQWLCYQDKTKILYLQNLRNGQEKKYERVNNYFFSSNGKELLLLTKKDDVTAPELLSWITFPEGSSKDIWSGKNSGSYTFDKSNLQLAFTLQGSSGKEIWYCKKGDEKARLLLDEQSPDLNNKFSVESLKSFNEDGSALMLQLKEINRPVIPGAVSVDVMSYQDKRMPYDPLGDYANESRIGRYVAAVNIATKRFFQLQLKNDIEVSGESDGAVAVEHRETGYYSGDEFWNTNSFKTTSLVSTNTGKRSDAIPIGDYSSFSPNGQFFVGLGTNDRLNFYCYDIKNKKTYSLTASIKDPSDQFDVYERNVKWLQKIGWTSDNKVLLADEYDIIAIDPENPSKPINLTRGFGRKNHIRFSLFATYPERPIPSKGNLIINAFNKVTKEAGFFLVNLDKAGDPVKLTMTPHTYQVFIDNEDPIDLLYQRGFIVRRESETEAPNYFLTKDFKSFTRLTHVEPQKNWNWLTAELHSFKGLTGRDLKGVLYKPENFDPGKKYPVIVHIYSNMSDKIHEYKQPKWTTDHLNIPWFVSNGYLVFTPDIYYKLGSPAESAFQCVEGAARYLKQLSFVDAQHIGLQGQSFGGYETNFIVTQSTSFAAAMASSGPTDVISQHNSWHQGFVERGQYSMRTNLWERPDLYVKNSPVFYVHKVQTPLLMMNNKLDLAVDFTQGIEFFTGLRRLGKRVWLLQYDGDSHVIYQSHKAAALQHTIRMTQFFNHYLKDSACPRWMLYGIPPELKGLEDGLELVREKDLKTGKWLTPKEGNILTDEEKTKVKALEKRKAITMSIE